MDNNIDFKDLWKKQPVSQPNFEDLLARLKQLKKAALRSLWITNILLIATSIFIAFIWYYYEPQFVSTKIGIIITILTMIIYLVIYNRLLKTYKNIDSTQTNQEYVQTLISIKKKQQHLQSVILSLYFVLLTIGLCLYMYEYASRMTIFWAVFTYAMTLFWMGINWFFIRPKQIEKQQRKINNLIKKFEEVNNQLYS